MDKRELSPNPLKNLQFRLVEFALARINNSFEISLIADTLDIVSAIGDIWALEYTKLLAVLRVKAKSFG